MGGSGRGRGAHNGADSLMALFNPLVQQTLTRFAIPNAAQVPPGAASAGATVWPLANLSLHAQFLVINPLQVFNLTFNAVVQSGNFDLGIYLNNLRVASSGSTAMGAGFNNFSPAGILAPGQYVAALSVDNILAQIQGISIAIAGGFQISGFTEMAASFPLPATLTPAISTRLYQPVLGIVL